MIVLAELQNEAKETSLALKNREILNLTGIEDVISFDEMSVYLVTGNGNLLIEGTGLHIIRSMLYNDKETSKKGGFFSKVMK